MLRTHTCGELRKKDAGKKVELCGWINSIRSHGSVVFFDLRDRYGIIQVVFSKDSSDFKEASKLSVESCVKVVGKVVERQKGRENKEIETGDIEVGGAELKIFTNAIPMPFEIGDDSVNEDVRLKYRYLDLRTKKMQDNLMIRHKVLGYIKKYMDENNFMEITTPLLTKSTPEGARDFIVPSRIHPGKFYALPQSPQQYKQLLMVAGMDRYYQIAPCLRDEDARANRCPGEFYQLDMEMSFIDREDILNLNEKLLIGLVKEIFPEKKIMQVPFPRLTYDEVMKKYGRDDPDLRKNKDDPNELAFCWVIDFPLFTKQTEEDFFHGAGKVWGPSHHMFTRPRDEDLKYLNEKDAGKAKSYQYDLVLNGNECAGGSIRIHDPKVQDKVFDLIGFDSKDKKKFEHLLKAFEFGVPPHGGIAWGFDRMLMVILGLPSIREVIAFPKNKAAIDLVMDAPSEVKPEQLKEAHIDIVKKKEKKGK